MSENPLAAWRDSVLRGEKRGMEFHHKFPRAASRWGMVQLLAGHPAPSRVLFLGATLGGDIRGAVRLGHEVVVADPSPEALASLSSETDGLSIPNESLVRTTPSALLDLGAPFDIVWVTPWWLANCRPERVALTRLLENAKECMAPEGRLLLQILSRRPSALTRYIARAVSGQPFPFKLFRKLPYWKEGALRETMVRCGLEGSQTFYVADGLTTHTTIINASLSPRQIARSRFGSVPGFGTRFRQAPLRILSALGGSPGRGFPFQIVSAGRNGERGTVVPDLLRRLLHARVTGRVVTALFAGDGGPWFVRVDTGCGSALREARLLEFLSEREEVAAFVHAPDRIQKVAGLEAAWYRYLPGYSFQGTGAGTHREQIEEFLRRLSSVPPPAFLEPAGDRLGRYLGRRREKAPERVKRALDSLERLSRDGAFRWITHGELRDGNIHVVREPEGLKVVDWVQSYRGHPLLDWWMYNYWNGAPEGPGHSPEQLRMGLTDHAVSDLWSVWRASYDR